MNSSRPLSALLIVTYASALFNPSSSYGGGLKKPESPIFYGLSINANGDLLETEALSEATTLGCSAQPVASLPPGSRPHISTEKALITELNEYTKQIGNSTEPVSGCESGKVPARECHRELLSFVGIAQQFLDDPRKKDSNTIENFLESTSVGLICTQSAEGERNCQFGSHGEDDEEYRTRHSEAILQSYRKMIKAFDATPPDSLDSDLISPTEKTPKSSKKQKLSSIVDAKTNKKIRTALLLNGLGVGLGSGSTLLTTAGIATGFSSPPLALFLGIGTGVALAGSAYYTWWSKKRSVKRLESAITAYTARLHDHLDEAATKSILEDYKILSIDTSLALADGAASILSNHQHFAKSFGTGTVGGAATSVVSGVVAGYTVIESGKNIRRIKKYGPDLDEDASIKDVKRLQSIERNIFNFYNLVLGKTKDEIKSYLSNAAKLLQPESGLSAPEKDLVRSTVNELCQRAVPKYTNMVESGLKSYNNSMEVLTKAETALYKAIDETITEEKRQASVESDVKRFIDKTTIPEKELLLFWNHSYPRNPKTHLTPSEIPELNLLISQYLTASEYHELGQVGPPTGRFIHRETPIGSTGKVKIYSNWTLARDKQELRKLRGFRIVLDDTPSPEVPYAADKRRSLKPIIHSSSGDAKAESPEASSIEVNTEVFHSIQEGLTEIFSSIPPAEAQILWRLLNHSSEPKEALTAAEMGEVELYLNRILYQAETKKENQVVARHGTFRETKVPDSNVSVISIWDNVPNKAGIHKLLRFKVTETRQTH